MKYINISKYKDYLEETLGNALLHAARTDDHDYIKRTLSYHRGIEQALSEEVFYDCLYEAMHQAAFYGSHRVLRDILMVKGIDINHRNVLGATALIESMGKGRILCVIEILKHEGVNTSVKDIFGRTAEEWASFYLSCEREDSSDALGRFRSCKMFIEEHEEKQKEHNKRGIYPWWLRKKEAEEKK